MKRLACIVLIITILVSGLALVRNGVHATTVGGNITSDSHWTINDSPVIFNASLRVFPNATLTIDPGVTVNFGSYHYLTISGTLIATGDPNNRITFTIPDNQTGINPIYFDTSSVGWSDLTNSGSIIQYASFNRVALQINSAIKVDKCYFSVSTTQPPITVSGGSSAGSPIISNNQIVFNGQDPSHYTYGISINFGTPVITNNEFDGNGQLTGINVQTYSPAVISNSDFLISNNIFSKCWLGVKAETKVSLAIRGNTFIGCHDGIDVNDVASLTIANNLIDGSIRYGINGGGYIDSNTITNNQVGIHNPDSGTIISNNNIVGNIVNDITASSASVNAENNWWGTTDVPTINQTIYDIYDDVGLGKIDFIPLLIGPSPSAPAIPVTTPNVTPIAAVIPTQSIIQSTPTPTIQSPSMDPTPVATPKSEIIFKDTSDLLNLNLMTTIVATLLILVWVIVILGYVAKNGLSKFMPKNKN